MSCYWKFLVVGLPLTVLPRAIFADSIKLEGGGTVKGQILDDKSTKDFVVIKLQVGGSEVKYDRKKIQEIIPEKSAVDEYEELKARAGDTAEEQYNLAMWCEAHKLSRQRREHLLKVIELDPDHAQAREKIGYVRRGGKWLTANELKEAKGLVRYQGRFVTPQQKEIQQQKKREEEGVKEWHAKIKLWKTWLAGNDPAKARSADEHLRGIDDPESLDAVLGQLGGKDSPEPLRILMCDILNNLPGELATQELVKRCIADLSANVRAAAVDKLVEREDPAAVRSLIKVLTFEQNIVVRRAAEALGAIGDPSAVPALIGALVTKHKQVITRSSQTSFMGTQTPMVVDVEPVVAPGVVAFNPVVTYQANGFGFSTPVQEVVVIPVENSEVRDALTAITKEDFGYNQAAWRKWLAFQKRKEDLKNRRPND